MQSIALNVKCFEQDDKPGYVVEWPSIELCRRRQNQATYPEADGPPYASCSVLLRMGFTCALSVTSQAVVSYTALPPLPTGTKCLSGGIFLLHCPWSRLHQTLSGILPCEARTFLTCSLSVLQPRPFVLLKTLQVYHIFLYLSSYSQTASARLYLQIIFLRTAVSDNRSKV